MKQTKTILLLIFVALFALAACGSPAEEPTAVPEPTEEPMEEPTAEPMEEPTAEPTEAPVEEATEEPVEEEAEEPVAEMSDELMLGVVWMWEEYQDNGEVNDMTIDSPENYTITFADDGNAAIKADCNNILASYTQESSSLTLALGPTTMVFCGEESVDTEYIEFLGNVATFVMDGDDLVLNLKADAGNMIFSNGGDVADMVEEPVSDLRTDNLEGETITFYHFGDLSGPYAAITGPLIHGMEDAVAAINADGGIRGATVEIEFADSAGSVDEAVAIYDRYTSEDDNIIIMFNYGSGEAEALASRFVEDEIPSLSSGLSSVAFYGEGSGYTFGLGPIYPDQFGAFLDYAVANWDDIKPESAGDEIKLAYLSWPGAFGQGALTDETRAYAEELGVEIVIEEIYDVAPTADTTTALLNAQAAGANVIWTNTLAFGPAALMNGIGALGLQGEFILAGDNWAMDLATYAFVSDPALAVGLYAPLSYLWWNDVDHPGIQYAESLFAENERGPGEHGVGYLLLIAGVDVAKQAIENAIDEVGFDALTGADVQRALAEMGPYEGLEGVVMFDYSDGSRSPHSVQIRQIQGGPDAFNVVQDFTDTPDLRPAE